jgi:hypothetical protein
METEAVPPTKRWKTWIPILTLAGIVVGFIAKKMLAPPPAELVIQPLPAARIAALEFPARNRALEGRVVDPAGAGVAEALVWLRAGDAPHFTYTDPEGRFRLIALESTPWHATVIAPGFAPLVVELGESESPQTIQLGAPLGPPPSLPLLPRAGLTGTVSSRGSTSFEGCEVVLTPTLPPEELGAPLPRRAFVGADGNFEFPDLIAGQYLVEVLPAWARGGTWPDLARETHAEEPRTFTHLAANFPQKLAIELQTGEVTGKLLDPDGHPIEGALILTALASDPSRVWPPDSSAGDGTFAVRGLPAGKYLLAIRAGSAALQREVLIRAGESTSLEFAPLDVRRSE